MNSKQYFLCDKMTVHAHQRYRYYNRVQTESKAYFGEDYAAFVRLKILIQSFN